MVMKRNGLDVTASIFSIVAGAFGLVTAAILALVFVPYAYLTMPVIVAALLEAAFGVAAIVSGVLAIRAKAHLSIAGAVCGLLCLPFVLGLVALVLGIVAKTRGQSSQQDRQ